MLVMPSRDENYNYKPMGLDEDAFFGDVTYLVGVQFGVSE